MNGPNTDQYLLTLIHDYGDASYDCGAWTKDSDETYEAVYAKAAEAKKALVEYVQHSREAVQS